MGQRVYCRQLVDASRQRVAHSGTRSGRQPWIAPLTDPGKPPSALPQAVIDLEALFDLLTDVMLRDQILVDDQFHDAWFGQGEPLAELARRSIVKPHAFLEHPERLEAPRRDFLRRLVLNDTMANEQASNEAAWKDTRTTPHTFTSQLVWGGAGMLARAWIYEAPYTPHPLRSRLFQRAGVTLPIPPTAFGELRATIAKHRYALYPTIAGQDGVAGLQVVLPALPALVLRDATSLTHMFVIASQMRDQLSELRTWLSRFQEAISAGEFKAIATERKRLRTLGKEVERALGHKSVDAASLNIAWSWLKLGLKLDLTAWLPKFDRVQVQASRVTFAPSGHNELKKLLGFFGHDRSPLGMRTMEHFVTRPASE